ncbi:hypothetical protein E2F50_20220 [Rhizobium deserti]|uniref:Uncharacterized protein n=1 Tax=Rhizobium deserti TaxID=2547961 RepID=A0A4R5U9I5_9HYPH|nr:hypothetical protein [Rhizobium deserti]TDK31269.1 hypothetical protein E2F50_20220 [Rhizobium deserti]
MSGYIEGISRDQVTLFPDCLGDWIDEDHLARVIEAFVDAMDLSGAGYGSAPEQFMEQFLPVLSRRTVPFQFELFVGDPAS